MPPPNRRLVVVALTLVLPGLLSAVAVPAAWGQVRAEAAAYAPKQSLGIFTAYSNDSSHMLLGYAAQRKLFDLGLSYNRRIVSSRVVNWEYSGELIPVALESDPVQVVTYTYTLTNPPGTDQQTFSDATLGACRKVSGSGKVPDLYTYTFSGICSRRWTIGTAMSPAGLQWNFLPRHRLQPFADGHGGYLFTTRPIPVEGSGSFNFTFDLGVGVEWFRTASQSMRFEYRYHHISNKNTAAENPGIDSGLFQFSYIFGH